MSDGDPDPLDSVSVVAGALGHLGVPYFVAGSLAGSVHGAVRSSADADIVADLEMDTARELVAALAPEFYIDGESVLRAVAERRSFSMLRRDSMFKVDVFVSRRTPFDASQMERRVPVGFQSERGRTIYVTSAEDTIVAKLVWYRAGGEVSERQWSDVLAMIRASRDALDRPYIAKWADALGVLDLWRAAETVATE